MCYIINSRTAINENSNPARNVTADIVQRVFLAEYIAKKNTENADIKNDKEPNETNVLRRLEASGLVTCRTVRLRVANVPG